MIRKLLLLGMSSLLFISVNLAANTTLLSISDASIVRGPIAPYPELDEEYLDRYGEQPARIHLGDGQVGDTIGTIFQAVAPCSLYLVEQQWFSPGSVEYFIAIYSDEANERFQFGRAPDRGSTNFSPIGEILFSADTVTVEGTGEWETIFTSEDMNGGIRIGDPDLVTNPAFFVGYVKQSDDGEPRAMAADMGDLDYTYTWFGGPTAQNQTGHPWGAYTRYLGRETTVEQYVRVQIDYPWGLPPDVLEISQVRNTFDPNPSAIVTAVIVDDSEWGENHEARVMVRSGLNGAVSAFVMDGPDTNNVLSAEITAHSTWGETVYYWVEATDDAGMLRTTEENPMSFNIIHFENPAAKLLVVDDGMGELIEPFIAQIEEAGISYEYWNMQDNFGLDRMTVQGGTWSSIFVFADGGSTVPTREWENSIYAPFVEGGGDFFLMDQDYFAANGEGDSLVFTEGDFAFDILG
ncbi:hypothetical protein K8I28_17470, partial [bacterium]|nr:hypothetical protein [bacterium]